MRGAALAALALACAGAGGARGDSCPAHLFVLARSKNANIVVYDAVRGPAGGLAASEPVAAYWLLGGEEGAREELNGVERQKAYGVDVSPGETEGTWTMVFLARPGRRFTVLTRNGCYVATVPISGHEGILRRMFVRAKEGLPPKVESVEFFGEDLQSGAPLYEKFVPGE